MNSHPPRVTSRVLAVAVTLLIGLAVTVGVSGTAGAAVVPTVPLATSATFGVLGGSTVTNTGPTTVTGLAVGVSPGSAITGFPPGVIAPPVVHAGDAVANTAQSDALIAYNNAAGRSAALADQGLADLADKTLVPGVYQGNLSLTGTVTLDNRTDPDAVFIFQASSNLITGTSAVVAFTTPHASCNVFWQVHDSATLGTGTTFVGTILAGVSITANTGATIKGRLLAATGAVTLDTNTISAAPCAVPPPTTDDATPTATGSSGGPTTGTGVSGTGTATLPPTGGTGTGTAPPTGGTGTATLPPTGGSGTTSSNITPPNENTTPSTLTLLTTTPNTTPDTTLTTTTPSITTGTSTTQTTGPRTVITTLTQPSFPTGVPGGSGPSAPISPFAVIGALLVLLGGLLLLWRIPATRLFFNRLTTFVARPRNRNGEHR